MHNIRTNFSKFYSICKELFDKEVDSKKNFQFYPVEPKMNDLEIIALSCCMEALSIDSENLLWSKLKTDYSSLFQNLIDRSRFNRRRKRLASFILQVQQQVSRRLQDLSQTMVVDSIPVPVVKLAREKKFKSFKKSFDTAPAKGYSSINKGWFIGYKLHVVIFDNGVVQQSGITKGNVHDINFLKQIDELPVHKQMVGDHAYISKTLQTDAEATNLTETSTAIKEIIFQSKEKKEKAICFVTGVPGAGKTLVGLDIATKHLDKENDLTSVFLSGNGPLVAILREALTRDKYQREKAQGKKTKKGVIMSEVKLFIQNVHNFRDEYLNDTSPPFDHITVFDEAQRAWDITQTANFMKRKRNRADITISEPEFLIGCLDRHQDWAVIVCLVGGGQEINTGEAGISEWIESLNRAYPEWRVYVSDKLTDSEYAAGKALEILRTHKYVLIGFKY